MFKTCLATLILFASSTSNAQNVIDADFKAGLGLPVEVHLFSGDKTTPHARFVVACSGMRQAKNGWFQVGMQLQYQGLSFTKEIFYGGHTVASGENVEHQSNYICAVPAIAFTFGENKWFHICTSVPVGFLLGGKQTNVLYGIPTVTMNATGYINTVYCGLSFGMKQVTPIENSNYFLMMEESYTFMLTSLTSTGYQRGGFSSSIHPNYLNLQIGILRKFGFEKRKK